MTTKDEGVKIIEYTLPGDKLSDNTNNVDRINEFGARLYEKNKSFIKEHVKETLYAIIDPTTGKFLAADNPLELFDYTQKNFPDKLFFFVGLLKNRHFIY